jgi:hypothetical protein
VDQKPCAVVADRPIAESDHFTEFPGGINVQQGKRKGRGMKSLHGQVEQDGGILADRIKENRVLELGDDLTEDVEAFGFELLQMARSAISAVTRVVHARQIA